MNKPKKTQKQQPDKRQERDFFETPNYATDLIFPFLPKGVVWECANGNGKIASRLEYHGFDCIRTDIETGQNFLIYLPDKKFDCIVTNPPFSIKQKFWERAKSLCVPFAFLLPVDFCGWILREMMDENNQWLIPTRRIGFITPTGRSGKESNPQFHSGWFCHNLYLPKQINVVELTSKMKENV